MHLPRTTTTTTIITPHPPFLLLLLLLLASLLPLLPSPPTTAALSLPPRDDAPAAMPRVASVAYSGSGCPSASPAVERTGTSWTDLAFRMTGFEASVPGTAPGSSSANCQVHLQAAGAAAGWQVGVRDVFVRGRAVLDPGATLDYYVTSFWSQDAGTGITIRGSLPNTGAARLDADVTAHTTVPDDRVVWSPCTGPDGALGLLNVNFRVALLADGGQYGYFGKGAGTAATESWGYVWRRC